MPSASASKKEVASLDRKMETRCAKIDELKAAMFDIDPTDFAALTAQQEAIAAAQEELEELEMAWLEASEQLSRGRPASSPEGP